MLIALWAAIVVALALTEARVPIFARMRAVVGCRSSLFGRILVASSVAAAHACLSHHGFLPPAPAEPLRLLPLEVSRCSC